MMLFLFSRIKRLDWRVWGEGVMMALALVLIYAWVAP